MSRYAVWTGALSGGLAESPVLDEMAYDIGLEGDRALATVKCDRFKEYYQAVEQKLIRADPARGKISENLSVWQQINNLPLVYRQFLVNYFKQPPAAQTLFVTLALGALGALTLNVLRLSKVGWWAQYRDPLWGEIMVSPLLGALAAFGIYLIGSAGLLLTTDMRAAQSGVTPLSAFFIGFLGFVSGLLYDEAFGRVRRLGTQLFAERIDRPEGRPEDKSLADALKRGSATRVAELVLKYGIGTRLAMESEFTFLVPSDEAVGQKPLQFWLDLNNEATSGRVLDDTGRGGDFNILEGIDWAIEQGCDIVSLSLGAPWQPGDPAFSPACESAAQRALAAGCLLVVAAGNEADDPQFVGAVGNPWGGG